MSTGREAPGLLGDPGDPGAARLLDDGRGDGRRDVAVEDAGDDVVLVEVVLGDDVGDPLRGGELHLLGDPRGAGVERAAEDPGEASTLLIWFG